MKTFLMIYALALVCATAPAQSSQQVAAEKLAREMHRVIQLDDAAAWEKFVRDNYSKALISKPMRAQVEGSGPNDRPAASSQSTDPVKAKADMFRMLHADFGNSEIVSLKTTGNKVEMVLREKGGLTGTFALQITSTAPFLIDGLGVEVGEVQR